MAEHQTKAIVLQGERRDSSMIIGDLTTFLWEMNRFNRQRISKDRDEFNHMINQLHIINIYRLFHTTSYTLFSNSQETFSKIDSILDHKTHSQVKKYNS